MLNVAIYMAYVFFWVLDLPRGEECNVLAKYGVWFDHNDMVTALRKCKLK